MRSRRMLCGMLLCVLLGCKSSDTGLKPPPMPEQYVMPPESDGRFSRAIEYPEGTLNQNGIRQAKQLTPPPAGIGANANGGMGGMGGAANNPAMNGFR